ncbi:MFS transporter [Streptomyces canus]
MPGRLALIGRAFPDDAARARAIGVWAGFRGLALPAGPLVGGALVDGLGRRAVFLINVPVVLLALLWSTAVVRESREGRARPLGPSTCPGCCPAGCCCSPRPTRSSRAAAPAPAHPRSSRRRPSAWRLRRYWPRRNCGAATTRCCRPRSCGVPPSPRPTPPRGS